MKSVLTRSSKTCVSESLIVVDFGLRRCLPECRVLELIMGGGYLRCGTIPIETLRR